eukprot:7388746-Prymnesium_polylepis.1
MPLQPEPEVLNGDATHDVMLTSFPVLGSGSRCPKGIWNKLCEQYRIAFELDSAAPPSANAPAAAPQGAGQKPEAGLIAEGYSKSTQGSIEALRVPFENFGGQIEDAQVNPVSLLSLIVDAVVLTRDYSVFGSRPLDILLEFKWHAFARFSFIVETALFCLHVAIAAVYNLAIADNIGTPVRVTLGLEARSSPDYLLLLGWAWTTTFSVFKGAGELKQLRAGGYDVMDYLSDVTNQLDLVL